MSCAYVYATVKVDMVEAVDDDEPRERDHLLVCYPTQLGLVFNSNSSLLSDYLLLTQITHS